MTGRARQWGFSLLEVLVAFAILAVSLGVLMQIFSTGALSVAVTERYSRAASLAEARLAAVGSAIPVEAGTVQGEPEDGFAWELTMIPDDLGLKAPSGLGDSLLSDPGQGLPAVPFRVLVTVLWTEGGQARHLSLSTLRLGEPAK
jgi:general secretion pathway protein I